MYQIAHSRYNDTKHKMNELGFFKTKYVWNKVNNNILSSEEK